MASPIISFRLSTNAVEELRKRARPGESENQAAQRLLNELLGTSKEQIEATEVDSRIQERVKEALAPIQAELAELRASMAKLGDVKASTVLTQAKLAERLGCDASSLNRNRDKADFSDWSRRQDPEGLGWQYLSDTRQFVPILVSEEKQQQGESQQAA